MICGDKFVGEVQFYLIVEILIMIEYWSIWKQNDVQEEEVE